MVVVYAVIAWLGWRTRGPTTDEPVDPTLRLREGGGTLVIRAEDVDWLAADGDYVRVHVGDRVHLVSHRLSELVERLRPHDFVQIHRSRLVNVRRIRSIRPTGRGDREVLLRCGTRLGVARRRASEVERVLSAL